MPTYPLRPGQKIPQLCYQCSCKWDAEPMTFTACPDCGAKQSIRERDEARLERSDMLKLLRERDAAIRERDEAIARLDGVTLERDAAAEAQSRNAMALRHREADLLEAMAERDAALSELASADRVSLDAIGHAIRNANAERDAALAAAKSARWNAVYGSSVAAQVGAHFDDGLGPPDDATMARFVEEASTTADQAEEAWENAKAK